MNYYDEIKNKLLENEIEAKFKDYSKEKSKVIAYFEIGRLLQEAGSKYGERVIGKYSERLMVEVGKKYNDRTLRSMRQFYVTFCDDFWKPLVSKLSWTHFLIIMPLKEKDKMLYYINLCMHLNLSKRQLQDRIKSQEYERLDEQTKKKLLNREELVVSDFIKNPIIIQCQDYFNEVSEKLLSKMILEDLDHFLTELGDGFCYIQNQYKIKFKDRYNYIDFLFYNIRYRCYVVVELKVTELKKEHIGQIQIYMNYIDKNRKTLDENETIGIIICKCENHFVMEYCSDTRIFKTTYFLHHES